MVGGCVTGDSGDGDDDGGSGRSVHNVMLIEAYNVLICVPWSLMHTSSAHYLSALTRLSEEKYDICMI